MAAAIYGLEDYGLTRAELLRLGPVKIRYSIHLRGPALRSLLPLAPAARRAEEGRTLRAALQTLREATPALQCTPRRPRHPYMSDAVSDVATLAKVLRCRVVAGVHIESIAGRRRRRLPQAPSLFAVRARVAIQIEGQRRGMQGIEDRIVVVMARSFEDAERRLTREWRTYASPYLNSSGQLVRWQFEEVVDVYALGVESTDPRGTEVFSSLSERRMKPEFEWHPRASGVASGRRRAR